MDKTSFTPQLQRLEHLESPHSRYAGRRVGHIEVASPVPVPPASALPASTPPSGRAKQSRSLVFAASPPLVKRSRSAEQSDEGGAAADDDEFLLAVAQENGTPAPRRDDELVSSKEISKNPFFFFFLNSHRARRRVRATGSFRRARGSTSTWPTTTCASTTC